MRDPRREGWVQRVEIDRQIDRSIDRGARTRRPGAHVDDLDAESIRLETLMRVERADTDLHEAIRQPLLHDPREWTGVRVPIALELVVQVGVRVQMQHGEPRVR